MEIDNDINRTAALFKQMSPSAPAPNPPPSALQLGAVRTISHQQSAINPFLRAISHEPFTMNPFPRTISHQLFAINQLANSFPKTAPVQLFCTIGIPGNSLPTHWPIQTSADTPTKTAPQIGPGEVQFPSLVLGILPVAISAFQVFSISAFVKKTERAHEYSLLLTFPLFPKRTLPPLCANSALEKQKTYPPVTLTFSPPSLVPVPSLRSAPAPRPSALVPSFRPPSLRPRSLVAFASFAPAA